MVVRDLYTFKTRKSLEALEKRCSGIMARLRQQERFSFALTSQEMMRLKPMMQFLHHERLTSKTPE